MSVLRQVYPGLIAQAISTALDVPGVEIDQHQSNGVWCVHQLRIRLPRDPTVYRVLVAPADAPIRIGAVEADQHFIDPITKDSP